jgi:hypothetical protein
MLLAHFAGVAVLLHARDGVVFKVVGAGLAHFTHVIFRFPVFLLHSRSSPLLLLSFIFISLLYVNLSSAPKTSHRSLSVYATFTQKAGLILTFSLALSSARYRPSQQEP